MSATTVLEGLPELRPAEAENLAGQTDEELGRGHLSHSSLNAQLACEQLYAYEYVDGIAPRATGAPRRMGGAFAKALEAGDPEVGVRDVVDRAVILNQADEDATRVEAMIVGSAATAYLERYGKTDPDERELGYRVRLRNPHTGAYSRTFDLEGYADGLVKNGGEDTGCPHCVVQPCSGCGCLCHTQNRDAGYTLIEDKLVGSIQGVAVRRLPLDRQLGLTCYGVWRATGRPVTKVRYRFTRKPSIKQKKGEELEEFLQRIEADYRERPDFYLHEEELERTTADLVRTEAELWQWAQHRRDAARQRIYPRNSSHCHDYGGCPFLPLCVGDPDAPSLYGPKPESDRASNNNNTEVTA